ncbi:MAG: hypothetical protein RJB38_1717 [Pseudomonadota bacterium]|jgi:hypothetical protein
MALRSPRSLLISQASCGEPSLKMFRVSPALHTGTSFTFEKFHSDVVPLLNWTGYPARVRWRREGSKDDRIPEMDGEAKG